MSMKCNDHDNRNSKTKLDNNQFEKKLSSSDTRHKKEDGPPSSIYRGRKPKMSSDYQLDKDIEMMDIVAP